MIGDGALVDDFALRVENADGVLLVAEIKTDGDGWDGVFHGSYECITALKRRPLTSHLILLGILFIPSKADATTSFCDTMDCCGIDFCVVLEIGLNCSK